MDSNAEEDLHLSRSQWCPTVDGETSLSTREARNLSKYFFLGGFLGLPFLWFVNCYYFWPVLSTLKSPHQWLDPQTSAHESPNEASETTPVLQESGGPRSPSKVDAEVLKYTRMSAVCCVVSATMFLGWTLIFQIGRETVFGKATWNSLLVYNVADKIEAWLLQGF